MVNNSHSNPQNSSPPNPNLNTTTSIPVPRSLKEALNGPHKDQWRMAIDKEYQSLRDNGTWELTDLLPGRQALPFLQ